MFHEFVKLLVNNSRRISDEKLIFTGNISKLSEGFPKTYKGLEVKIGFGKGNWASVTWIGFLAKGQAIRAGIYPVYLYYREEDILILAYGVSETYSPNIEWPISKDSLTVGDYFTRNHLQARRYRESYVYKAYTKEDLNNITADFDNDLNALIDTYKAFINNTVVNESFNQIEVQDSHIVLQTIYFGSPGTGKSFKIKDEILNGVNEHFIFRTTFHPDTDYASFVGCYKPIANKTKLFDKAFTIEELADIYKREVGPTENLKTGHIEPRILFGIKYCEFFGGSAANYDANKMLELAGKELANGCQEDRVGVTYVKYGINIGLKMGTGKNNSAITYDFAPQTFTDAYVTAWQNPTESVYLVIEEINRGNCAQIFGDLFQLLDRDEDGISEYPIKADADLTKHLQDKLGIDHEGIADGNIKLPANLHIIATMNTSDQSLFPMDSAFKRRWEWKYVPTNIKGDKKKVLKVESKEKTELFNREQEKKVLRLGMYEYDWSVFLEKINKCITDATHSDDKQLGFWFVKTPKNSNEIKIETFVSKVIFYLWTDVFKDFGAKETNPFAFKNAKGALVVCPFSSFFDPYTGDINLGQIHGFMYNLGIIPDLEPEIQAAIDERNEEEGNPEAQ